MKKILYIFLLLISIGISAQKIAVKEVDFKGQTVFIELEDIDHFELNNNSDGKLMISMDEYLQAPNDLSIQTNDKEIFIKSKIIEVDQTLEPNKYCAIQPFFASYILSIPKDATVYLIYKDGNLKANSFDGDLKIELNKGHLEFENYNGNLEIQLYAGSVKASFKNVAVDLSSTKGQIIAHMNLDKMHKTKSSLRGNYQNQNNMFKVRTILANIDLSPVLSQ